MLGARQAVRSRAGNGTRLARRARRMLGVGAALCLLSTGLTACGSGGGSAGDANTLTIWTYQDTKSTPFYKTFETQFKKSHPKVSFKVLYVNYPDMANKLIAAAATRTGPDVVIYDPTTIAAIQQSGALADITSQWSSFADKDQFPDVAVNKVDGKVYSVQAYVNTTALIYNKDVLSNAGITDAPTTFAELQDDIKKVVAKGDKGITMCGAPTTECETQAAAWILGSGGNYDDIASSAVTGAFQGWADIAKSGGLIKDDVTWGQVDSWNAFAKGGVAFTQNGNWNLGALSKLPFKTGIVPLPGGKVAPGGEGEAVGAFSKNKKLAFELLSSTWWTKQGGLDIVQGTGSIPVRKDVQTSSAVADNPNLAAYTKELQDPGVRTASKNPADFGKVATAVGQAWSSVLAGDSTGAQATAKLKTELAQYF